MHVGLEVRIQDIAVEGSSKSGFGKLVGKAGVAAFLVVALKEVIRFATIADEEFLGVVVRERNGGASEFVLDEDVVDKSAMEFNQVFTGSLSRKGITEDTAGGEGGVTEGDQMEESLIAISAVDNGRIPWMLGGDTTFLAEVLTNKAGPCFQRRFMETREDISRGGTKGEKASRVGLRDKMFVGHDIDATIKGTSEELGVEAANRSRITSRKGGSCITECLGVQVGLKDGTIGNDATFAKTRVPEVGAGPIKGTAKGINNLIGEGADNKRGGKFLVLVESSVAGKDGSRENPGIEGGMVANTGDRVFVRGIEAEIVIRIVSGTGSCRERW
jgi:hypothetical protein